MTFNRCTHKEWISENNLLDVRKVLESPIERLAKSLIINDAIDVSDDVDEDLGELTDFNEVIHNDPVLDVISAFFGRFFVILIFVD